MTGKAKKDNDKLKEAVKDQELIDFFYLDLTVEQLIKRLHSLKFSQFSSSYREIPFTARNREYIGAYDNEEQFWLVKPIKDEEIFLHKLFEIAYYIDFRILTLSAPTILIKHEGSFYRATKLLKGAMQIHSYNYLQAPFLKVLATDLINRWLFFDEDRNPNNYLVLQNSAGYPLIVAIDNNKVDLESEEIKITGNNEKFGWYRSGKTRFLTLLTPENFENLTIDIFEGRLTRLNSIKKDELKKYCLLTFNKDVEEPEAKADLIVSNFVKRRDYITKYFREWFKEADLSKEKEEEERYSGLGKSFFEYYKKKR